MIWWVQAGEVGNRVTNGCGDATRTDVSASIVPATATAVAPDGPGIRFQSGAPLKAGYRRGRGQSQASSPADITRLVATGSTAALCPSAA